MEQEEKPTIRIAFYFSGNMYDTATRRMVFLDDLLEYVRSGGLVINTEYKPDEDGYYMTEEILEGLKYPPGFMFT